MRIVVEKRKRSRVCDVRVIAARIAAMTSKARARRKPERWKFA
jgi:hypothetical protein